MINRFSKKCEIFSKLFFAVCFTFFVLNISAQNFKQEAVEFQNEDIKLSGTLFLPDVKQKTPAVVILHGSGPDEGLGYKIYGEEFSKLGIATLVYDKRGSGKSGGDWQQRSFENMANDALAAVKYLQNRPEIDSKKVGIWGISQGGWTAAFAAARSENVAFVISVSGNGISPTKQEMFHKDEMYQALGYSEKARDTALKFWKLAFDWLVLVDEGKFPLPKNLMQSELSAASIGLNYDPLPDWEKVKQPVLLIHGEKDKLSPHNEAIATIFNALKKGGNENLTVRVFPNASHTITTNKTGLEFDWEDNFVPDYFQFTTDWIKAKTNGENFSNTNPELKDLTASADFEDGGRYGKLSWFGKTYPQLLLMFFFPVFYFGYLLFCIFRIIKKEDKIVLKRLSGGIALLNFLLVICFFVFIGQSIFPFGIDLVKNYSIPVWQKILPLIGDLSLIFSVVLLAKIIINRSNFNFHQIVFLFVNCIFAGWLYYWNFLGFLF
ncbi:MAG: alpha/beta fold hydrolase [Acidobacteriota bacterium]